MGRALLGHVIASAQRRGVDRFYLEVAPENATAVGLYRTLGFDPVKTLPGFFPDGREALRMVRDGKGREEGEG